ncbi:flagellar hook-basal body protein [Ralstonia pickettii]|nr:flagellar hook-basal body protein [Ralstonia pickettii]
MSRTMIQAAVTMNQLQNKLDLIGHNMANSQTPGYKARKSEFSSLLFQNINNLNAQANADNRLSPVGVRIGTGARLGATSNNFSLGALNRTERALDAALRSENHFFQIQTVENGIAETRYSRDGSFYLTPTNNQEVMLTTGDGNPVLGQNGPIILQNNFDSILINDRGQIVVERGNQQEIAGEIAVVQVNRPQLLETASQNLFRLPDLNALGFNFGEVIQPLGAENNLMESGVLEQSNVDIAEQMSDLLTAQRAYQFNASTISTSDQMMGLINQLRS